MGTFPPGGPSRAGSYRRPTATRQSAGPWCGACAVPQERLAAAGGGNADDGSRGALQGFSFIPQYIRWILLDQSLRHLRPGRLERL